MLLPAMFPIAHTADPLTSVSGDFKRATMSGKQPHSVEKFQMHNLSRRNDTNQNAREEARKRGREEEKKERY